MVYSPDISGSGLFEAGGILASIPRVPDEEGINGCIMSATGPGIKRTHLHNSPLVSGQAWNPA